MRKYKQSFNRKEVDLDDQNIYKYLPDTIDELNFRMLREIGYATCYMDYWHPDIFNKRKRRPILEGFNEEQISQGYPDGLANSGYYQRQRVYKLIENFTKNRTDNWGNILWFKEQVFLFEDEIENMC